MSVEDFAKEMEAIAALDSDPEKAHVRADDLMCRVLRGLGYGEGIDIFNDIEKWYA